MEYLDPERKGDNVNLLKLRQRRYREKKMKEDNIKLQRGWRLVNQYLQPKSDSDLNALNFLSNEYEKDVLNFHKANRDDSLFFICGVCGVCSQDSRVFHGSNDVFSVLRSNGAEQVTKEWNGYYRCFHKVYVCMRCLIHLKKNQIPKLSKVNIPLLSADPVLSDLNEVERLLISPILPVTYVWKHHVFGQYKSKGQPIAFQNTKFQQIAASLPRTTTEILFSLDKSFFGRRPIVRIHMLREAFNLLKSKYKHPAFANIYISEENISEIRASNKVVVEDDLNELSESIIQTKRLRTSEMAASQVIYESGQHQYIEEEVAEEVVANMVSIDSMPSGESLRKIAAEFFQSISNKKGLMHNSVSKTADWENMFPCLLPDGNGGPQGLFRAVSLREWISYVLQISSLTFHKDLNFIFYAHNIVRRHKITGVAHYKPIHNGIIKSVQEMQRLAKSNSDMFVPFSTLQSLVNQLSFHVDRLPGSISDMSEFRRDIFSMIASYGPPTYFVTLSAADSIWQETFLHISSGTLNLKDTELLNAKLRAELLANNPVRVTIAWKRRVDSFLDFVCNGKSKPLGTVLHYAMKAEWQARCSEHVHILFWCSPKFPGIEVVTEESNGLKYVSRNEEICSVAETYASTWLPLDFSDTFAIKRDFETIQRNPIRRIKNVCFSKRSEGAMQDLLQFTQLHRCTAYCTGGWKHSCKSRFPFDLLDHTELKEIVDHKGNHQYRVFTRRNHSRINSYHCGIMNLWRANMDITCILGDAYSTAVYLALYASKTEKMTDLSDVIRKLRNAQSDEISSFLRKALLVIDGSRAVGAPEAASNLLNFPHWKVSSKVLRIGIKAYHDSKKINGQDKIDSLNDSEYNLSYLTDILSDISKDNENFNIAKCNALNYKKHDFDKLTKEYFARPTSLLSLSHKIYTETYTITHAKQKHNYNELLNKEQKYVIKRCNGIGKNVILDLKYRISPPDTTNEDWCLGVLVLYIPHVSAKNLLGGCESFVQAYSYYKNLLDINGNTVYPELQKFKNDEMHLYETKNNYIRRKDKTMSPTQEYENDQELRHIEDGDRSLTEIENINYESIKLAEDNVIGIRDDDIRKPWNGCINIELASIQNSLDYVSTEKDLLSNAPPSYSNIADAIEKQKPYLKEILQGKNPERERVGNEENSISDKDRREAGDNLKTYILNSCKTNCQKTAVIRILDVIETYYFGSNSSTRTHEVNPELTYPFCCMIGVPGAGKSWIIKNIQKWVNIRIPTSQRSHLSDESITIDYSKKLYSDAVTAYLSESIKAEDKRFGLLGKAPAIAYSGSAAGIVKGDTIHKVLGFGIKDLTRDIMRGIIPLPPLEANKRKLLYEQFKSAKVLIIDEVFAIESAMLAIIDQRLRDILNPDKLFGGLVVIISGDPRQIIPISGRALFNINKYFCFAGESKELKSLKEESCKRDKVYPMEMRGYYLYSLFKIQIPLLESIRLQNSEFASLSHSAATYNLNMEEIEKLNSFHKPNASLYQSPWIDAVWLIPTWKQINQHLNIVTRYMSQTRGIFRLWSHVYTNSNVCIEKKKEAIKVFYNSSIAINSEYNFPLPYIDIFQGQVLNLKNNWCPSLQFYRNSKVVVVGIHVYKPNEYKPNLSVNEASLIASRNLSPHNVPCEILVKYLTGAYNGPSALPHVPGIFVVPWTSTRYFKYKDVRLQIKAPFVHPANAISCHQSQGNTLPRSVALLSKETERYYGMANVCISRTPDPTKFALAESVNIQRMQPKQKISNIVEEEYRRVIQLSTDI